MPANFLLSMLAGMDIKTFTQRLGQGSIAERMGVELPAVERAVDRGRLPASWYVAIKRMAADAGIDCPNEFFRMKGLE